MEFFKNDFMVVVFVFTILLLGYFILMFRRYLVYSKRDETRAFSSRQRASIAMRAGGRCERKPVYWFRCRSDGEHADHIHPWSRGGATSISNGQWLCAKHNLSKGNRIPKRNYIRRLRRRRKNYFPYGENPSIYWKIDDPRLF